ALVAQLACSPTVPSDQAAVPTIVPTVATLKTGEAQRYELAAGSVTTPVHWTTSRADVCVVDGNGQASAVGTVDTLITAVAGDKRASLLVRVVPSADGFWTGQAKWLGDKCISGNCPRSSPPTGGDHVGHYEVRIQQIHDQVTAVDSWSVV